MSEIRVGLSSISEVMLTGEHEVIGEKPVPLSFFSHRKSRMYYPRGWNPDLHSKWPATNCVRHDTVNNKRKVSVTSCTYCGLYM